MKEHFSSSSDLEEIWMMQLPIEHVTYNLWNIPKISQGWMCPGNGVELKYRPLTNSNIQLVKSVVSNMRCYWIAVDNEILMQK